MEKNRMKNIKKNTLKVLVLVALLCPVAFADDGDMGGGGFADSGTVVKSNETTNLDGDMGGGGLAADSKSYLKSVLDSLYDYFEII
jgi:hypothetical protein